MAERKVRSQSNEEILEECRREELTDGLIRFTSDTLLESYDDHLAYLDFITSPEGEALIQNNPGLLAHIMTGTPWLRRKITTGNGKYYRQSFQQPGREPNHLAICRIDPESPMRGEHLFRAQRTLGNYEPGVVIPYIATNYVLVKDWIDGSVPKPNSPVLTQYTERLAGTVYMLKIRGELDDLYVDTLASNFKHPNNEQSQLVAMDPLQYARRNLMDMGAGTP